MIRPLVHRSEPEVPVQRRWNGRRFLRPADPLLPQQPGAIGPDVDFAHIADHTRLNPFIRQPGAFGRVPLVAHLSGDARLVRGLGQRRGIRGAYG